MSASTPPTPSQSLQPTHDSMRDSPSHHPHEGQPASHPASPPPRAPAGSPWAEHELAQGTTASQNVVQHRSYAPRDSGISLGERQSASPSHARDDASQRQPDSASRALSPHSSGGARSSGPTSPRMAHPRPPSALSSTSSSHAPASSQTFPSPRPLQHPYASSSLSSAAAFDYDDLLGPHPRQALSGTSVSPPSSNEDDKLRRVLSRESAARVHGLGFTAPTGGRGGGFGELYGPDEGGDGAEGEGAGEGDTTERGALGDDEDELGDEPWDPLRALSISSATGIPTPPRSSPPSAATPAQAHSHSSASLGQQAVRQASVSSSTTSAAAALVGSPLSPHVAPFAPSSAAAFGGASAGGQSSSQGSPWATQREREASWNSVASSTYASQAQQRALPSLASGGTHCPMSPYASHFGDAGAPAMSESPSLGASLRALGGETYLVSRGGPPRTPYLDRGADSATLNNGGHSSFGYNYGSAAAVAAAAARPGSAAGLDAVSAAAYAYEAAMAADVSTIFVVGFPDDMTEREFTNMFAFAEGFEAATLKFPWPRDGSIAGSDAGDRADEFTAAAAAAATGQQPQQQQQQQLATAFEGFATGASTPLSTTASANGMTPGARKIIGFARFATREQALDARDTLSGRRVDYERGSILKAEMAKKNLHMRKNVVVTTTGAVGAGAGAGAGSTPSSGTGTGTGTAPASAYGNSAPPGTPFVPQQTPVAATATADSSVSTAPAPDRRRDGTGPSIPLSAIDAAELQKIAKAGNLPPAAFAEIARQNLVNKAAVAAAAPSAQADSAATAAYEAFHVRSRSEYYEYEAQQVQHHHQGGAYPLAPSSATSSSPPHQPSLVPGLGQLSGQRSMLQQLDEGLVSSASAAYTSPDLRGGVATSGRGSVGVGPHSREPSSHSGSLVSMPSSGPVGAPNPYSTYASPGPGAAPLSPTLAAAAVGPVVGGGGPVPSAAARQAAMHPLGSPTLGFAPAALGGLPRTQNPADMNAPKNTLYVGGLPAVLPSLTGPFSASHLEDSLRNAFSRCPGYKRLQFRYKSNGPIVFVEFVDTAHATRAMQELYGHTLGGLVKGGIRLSYSKNPLGVRSNGQPALPPPELLDQRPPPHVLAHHHHQQQPQQGGSIYGPSQYVGSPVGGPGAFSFEPVGVEPYRRPPDPIYGDTAYPRPSPSLSSPPYDASSSTSGFGAAGAGAPSPSSTYGGAFSPFSVEL